MSALISTRLIAAIFHICSPNQLTLCERAEEQNILDSKQTEADFTKDHLNIELIFPIWKRVFHDELWNFKPFMIDTINFDVNEKSKIHL